MADDDDRSVGTNQARMNAFVTGLYAETARDYDRQLLVDCGYRTPDRIADLIQERNVGLPSSPSPWLELGAGTGLVGRALRERGVTAPLFGLDMVPAMLERADEDIYALRCVADVTLPLPFESETFELVLAISLMEHVVNPGPMLCEVSRVLAPGGSFVFTFCPSREGSTSLFEPFAGLLAHDPVDLLDSSRSCGMRVEHQVDFDAYQSGRDGWIRTRAMVMRKSKPSPAPRKANATGEPRVAHLCCPSCLPLLSPIAAWAASPASVLASLDEVSCPTCGGRYPVVAGVVRFLADSGSRSMRPSNPSSTV